MRLCRDNRVKYRDSLYCFYRWILFWCYFSACGATGMELTGGTFPAECSAITEIPATAPWQCNKMIVHRPTLVSGPEKLKVMVCPLGTDDTGEKEYLLYSDSPNQPVWLCRSQQNKEKREDARPPEFPPLTITIADDSDTDNTEITTVSGYGGDSFDDQWPKKPPMPGRQVTPFLLETISTGLLPVEMLSFTGDITDNKLTRALAAVFSWQEKPCTDIPGIWVCPKEGRRSQSQQAQNPSTAANNLITPYSSRGSRKAQRAGGPEKNSDDQGGGDRSLTHDHQSPCCPHQDCYPHRCRCHKCQPPSTWFGWLQQKIAGLFYSRNPEPEDQDRQPQASPHQDLSSEDPFTREPLAEGITINQAISAIGSLNYKKYQTIGFFLGIPHDAMTQLSGDEEQRTQAMLELAQAHGCLTSQKLIRALSVCCGKRHVREAVRELWVPDVDPEPACYQQQESPDLDAPMSPEDAYLICSKTLVNTLWLGVEMGLTDQVFEIEEEKEFLQRLIRLLVELHKHHLLNYGPLISALKHQGLNRLIREPVQKLKLDLPPRQPDYRVYSGNRVRALTQPLSLRDLVDIVPFHIPREAVAQGLGCPEEAGPEKERLLPKHFGRIERMILLLARCQKRKGAITANDVIKMFYHPELLLLSEAHDLAAALTGQPHGRERIPLRQMILGPIYFENLKEFGLALGLPERLLISVLTESIGYEEQLREVFRKAIDLDRLTPENLVYAMEMSGNAQAIDRIDWLRGVEGRPLPEDQPVFLARDESGQAFEEPMETEARSEPITLANTGGLPFSHNWFWIGLAMGLSDYDLTVIHKDCRKTSDRWFRVLHLLESEKYETRHLYDVLRFLEDEEAVRAFPKELTGKPRQSLAALAPTAIMGHSLVVISRALKDQADLLAERLELDEFSTYHILRDYQNDPQRVIVELIHKSLNLDGIHTRQEFLDKLLKVAVLLDSPELKINVPEAMSWAHQQEMPLLERRELRFDQQLRAAALARLDVPPEFRCPITFNLVVQPVRINGGTDQAFEREDLLKWVRENQSDPLTRAPISESDVWDYPEILPRIAEWLNEPVEQTQSQR